MSILFLFYKMKNVIVIILINCLFPNVNFEILNLPKDIYSLNSNNGILDEIQKTNNENLQYKTNFLRYPDNIMLYTLSTNKKINVSILDYGILENKINNEIINSFKAFEALIQYNVFKKYKKINIKFSPSIVYGTIDTWTSCALFTNVSLFTKNLKSNISLQLSIKKIGTIFNSYANNNEYLPISYQLGIAKEKIHKNLYWGIDIVHEEGFNQTIYSLSIKKKINEKITLLSNINSNRNKLLNNNFYNNIFSGFSSGIILKEPNFNVGIGLSSLGQAGYVYCISFEFK